MSDKKGKGPKQSGLDLYQRAQEVALASIQRKVALGITKSTLSLVKGAVGPSWPALLDDPKVRPLLEAGVPAALTFLAGMGSGKYAAAGVAERVFGVAADAGTEQIVEKVVEQIFPIVEGLSTAAGALAAGQPLQLNSGEKTAELIFPALGAGVAKEPVEKAPEEEVEIDLELGEE